MEAVTLHRVTASIVFTPRLRAGRRSSTLNLSPVLGVVRCLPPAVPLGLLHGHHPLLMLLGLRSPPDSKPSGAAARSGDSFGYAA